MPRVKITEAAFGADSDGFAKVLDGASVQVNVSGGSAATVYSASTGSATLTNPVTSDNGRIPGWLDEGSYDLVVTYDGVTADAVPFEARAAYPDGGAEGDVLTVAADGGVEWTAPTAITAGLPWTIDINPLADAATETGWETNTVNSLYLMNAVRATDDGSQNNEVGWDVVLAAGTWTIGVHCIRDTDYGKATVSLDGSSVGTMDFYNSTTVANTPVTVTGVDVATSGKKRLLFKMADKNASSSSYKAAFHMVWLRRTA